MSSVSTPPRLIVHSVGGALAVTQLLFLPSAHSAFRTVKEAWVLSVICVLVVGVCLAAARRGRIPIPASGLTVSLLTLPVLSAASALWAADPRRALLGAATTATWSVGAIALATFPETERRIVVLWAAAGAAISSLVLVGQFFELPLVSLPGRSASDRLRLIGTSGNPADAAMAGVLMLPLLIPLLGRPLKSHRLVAATIGAIVVGAMLSQSLTALASLAMIGGLVLVTHRTRPLWLGTAAVVAVTVVVVAASPLRGRVAALPGMVAEGDWNRVLSARTDGWSAALTMFGSRPTVGIGNDHYSREFFSARAAHLERTGGHGNRGEVSTHFEWAHNDVLELVAEFGVVGLLWMATFLWAVFRASPDRSRLALVASAWIPFLMLHYPTHLAVGALPGCLLAAGLLAPAPRRGIPGPPIVGWVITCGMAAAAWWTVGHQLSTVRLDLWRGTAEQAVIAAQLVSDDQRQVVLASIEKQAAIQIARHPVHAGWLWRLIGKARLVDGRFTEAEGAFRRAGVLMPHEEAAFGLGDALLQQGRFTEAVEAYGPVVRLNPVLINQIPSPTMQKVLRRRLLRDTANDS